MQQIFVKIKCRRQFQFLKLSKNKTHTISCCKNHSTLIINCINDNSDQFLYRLELEIDCRLPTWLGFIFRNKTVFFTNGTVAPFKNFVLGYIQPTSGYIYSSGWQYGTSSWKVDNGSSSFAFACQYRPSKTLFIRNYIVIH